MSAPYWLVKNRVFHRSRPSGADVSNITWDSGHLGWMQIKRTFMFPPTGLCELRPRDVPGAYILYWHGEEDDPLRAYMRKPHETAFA